MDTFESSGNKTPRVALFGLVSKHRGRNRGGTAVSIAILANYLAANGLTVDIVMRRPDPGFEWPRRPTDTVKIHHLDADHKWGLFLRLCGYLSRYRPQAVLAVDMRANLIASWSRRVPLIRVPTFASLRNAIDPGSTNAGATLSASNKRGARMIGKYCSGVVAISHGLATEFSAIAGIPVDSIHVIHNPIIGNDIQQRASEPVTHPWLASKAVPVVLGVGRLSRQKDFPTLIRAFALLRAERNCRLVILGQGEDESSLKRLIAELELEDDVSLPGFVSNPLAYMAKADLFVLSSAWEGFGNVLAEAMATGVPLVSTDCRHGPREILDGGRYGRLVPVGDAAQLAQAMSETLDAPPDRMWLKAAADRFRIETQGQRYLEVMGLKQCSGRP